MNWKFLSPLFCIVVLAGCSTTSRETQISDARDEISTKTNRIFVSAQVNAKPVRFIFDTGADVAYLTAQTAQRLGLRTSPSTHPTDKWMVGVTQESFLTLNGSLRKQVFPVIDLTGPDAAHFPAGGFLGWLCYRNTIFRIDAANLSVTAYNRVPEDVKTWQKFRLRPDSTKFIFEVPLPNGVTGEVFVDTGASDGVGLYPDQWRAWKTANPNLRMSLHQAYMPYRRTGLIMQEVTLADKVVLGPLTLTKLPVMETSPAANAHYDPRRRLATMGMAALRRMDVLVDNRHGFVYLRPKP
ncbi:MAG: retropepsin-like aspartic protease [Chthoniobacterales bacterium]